MCKTMANYEIVKYDDKKHRTQFFNLNLEYLTYVDNENKRRYGITLNPDGGSVEEYLKTVFNKFTKIEPPNGIIYILERDGRVEGMGAIRRIDEGIGEIKRMYIRPRSQGKGFGKWIYEMLEAKARGFGLSTLRLDTAGFAEAAIHIYRKNGFTEIDGYLGGEWDNRNDAEGIIIYMEKKL
jgi:GNAT superfamily N-acetyltransferase